MTSGEVKNLEFVSFLTENDLYPFTFVCVNASVSVGRLRIGVLSIVLHQGNIKTDVFFEVFRLQSAFFTFDSYLFSPMDSPRNYLVQKGMSGKNVETSAFCCGLDSASSFCLRSFK